MTNRSLHRQAAYQARTGVAVALLAGWLLGASAHAATAPSCTPVVARVVSIEGSVKVAASDGATPHDAQLDEAVCAGYVIELGERSRAALQLPNETVVRLDQRSRVVLSGFAADESSRLALTRGALHVITRTRQRFQVTTPFINANVNGTEFTVRLDRDGASVSVVEGEVVAARGSESLALGGGEVAIARANEPLRKDLIVQGTAAVQWALHYPAVFDCGVGARVPGWASVRDAQRAVALCREARFADAIEILDASAKGDDPRTLTFRAGMLLAVGRYDEAQTALDAVLRADPNDGQAYALLAVMALVRGPANPDATALQLANKAVEVSGGAAPARVALSYALQAAFRIDEALDAVLQIRPDARTATAWARIAELELSKGNIDAARAAAAKALELDDSTSRAYSMLGYADLLATDLAAATRDFEQAIARDQSDPFARLGLGLTRIRGGDLPGGREQLEVAAILDPGSSLIRSYLGKAYYEEKRDKEAATQFELAKERDQYDPTPLFYDAILKQSVNRAVEALDALQRSIELNDNRSVYRSKLLIDQDQAERGVAQARIYSDIGFDRLALNAGADSLALDPANSAAHRLLADAYVDLPRHEISRVSELLQSQLRQPLTFTPTQLQLGEERFVSLRGAGPAQGGLNEYNSLFNRNGVAFQASGIVGGNSTAGDELMLSGIQGRWGYSIGQLAYHTDGFRENNDFRNSIYDAFVQYQANDALSVQAEVRRSTSRFGDTVLRFDPNLFAPDRQQLDATSYRVGARYQFSPRSELIGSAIVVDSNYTLAQFDTELVRQDFHTYIGELQHTWRDRMFDVITGAGVYSEQTKVSFVDFQSDSRPHAANAYVYGDLHPVAQLQVRLGISVDHIDATNELGGSKTQTNPKLGVTWALTPATTLRAAAFRTLKRRFFANQTLEPTEVAGFNQFFDDFNATDAKRYGVALDHRFSNRLFAGIEASKRDLRVPQDFTANEVFDWHEREAVAYLYWAAHEWVALSARYRYERFERPPELPGQELFTEVTTRTLPLRADFHHPNGMLARVDACYVKQSGMFYMSSGGPDPEPGSDRFWVVDLTVGYRLPQRLGMITAEVKNAFDKIFRYQETDLFTPAFARRRVFFLRAALSF